MEKCVVTVKDGKTILARNEITASAAIHERLNHDLIAKYLHKVPYIKSITDRNNFNGTRHIAVTYDNGVKADYTIKF